jgi:RNA-directed DNA polymerase
MHQTLDEQGPWLRSVVQGYYNYFAVPGNMQRLCCFRDQVLRSWLATLRRRSQRSRLLWRSFRLLARTWIPPPRVLHPYPDQRFYAKYPR